MFRNPDSNCGQDWAVWYDPQGRKGENATEIEAYGSGNYLVRQFQLANDDIEEYDESRPFLCVETFVSEVDIETERARVNAAAGRYTAQIAAELGTRKIHEQGGHESFAVELPQ